MRKAPAQGLPDHIELDIEVGDTKRHTDGKWMSNFIPKMIESRGIHASVLDFARRKQRGSGNVSRMG